MKLVTIRELHQQTGRWVRYAAEREAVVVTDRGRRVAALQAVEPESTGTPLPNREARIKKRSRVPVDSGVYLTALRDRP